MTDGVTGLGLRIAARLAQAATSGDALPASPSPLELIDQAVVVVAIALALSSEVWWRGFKRQDPLVAAPVRLNRLDGASVAMVMLVYVIAGVGLLTLAEALLGDEREVLGSIIAGNGGHLAALAACLCVASRQFEGGAARFIWGTPGTDARRWIVGGVFLAILAVGLCQLVGVAAVWAISHWTPGFEFQTHPTIAALQEREQPLAVTVALWVGAAVVAPIAEESFFRGLLQTALVKALGNRWLAIAVASLHFGLVHASQMHVVGALAVLAVLLGYAYERTGSLLPPILIHAAFNLKTLIWDALNHAAI